MLPELIQVLKAKGASLPDIFGAGVHIYCAGHDDGEGNMVDRHVIGTFSAPVAVVNIGCANKEQCALDEAAFSITQEGFDLAMPVCKLCGAGITT